MRLKKLGDLFLSAYGVVTAVDKLNEICKEEQRYKDLKKIRRDLRRGNIFRDYESLLFNSKDAAFDFLDRIRDTIDRDGYISCAEVSKMIGLVLLYSEKQIGWYVLYDSDVKMKKIKDKWRVKLPRPVMLENIYKRGRARYNWY